MLQKKIKIFQGFANLQF